MILTCPIYVGYLMVLFFSSSQTSYSHNFIFSCHFHVIFILLPKIFTTVVHWLPFQWSWIEEDAYRSLKVMLSHAPVVQPPDWSQPFHVFVDASDMAIGSAIMKCTQPKWYGLVHCASGRLSATEKNYSTTEGDVLNMVYNITKFWHYLLGRRFTFHVNHLALLYLVNKQALTGWLA